jgi:phage gpG-like protein
MIKIEIDSRIIAAALARLEAAVTDMRPAFDDIGASLVANIQLQLGQGETPWGDLFEPLKRPRKRQGKGIGGDVPLNDTRQHIYNRITHNLTDNGVEVGMLDNGGEDPIGQTHQFGRGKILARPFMPIKNGAVDLPADWLDEILETIERHISKAL